MLLLGEAHWLSPPTLARHHSNYLHELFWQEVLVKNMELINRQPEELGKGQKETPHVRSPPRILLTGIHIDWTRHARPGRTVSQNDWLKTTQKLIPSPQNTRLLCGRAVPLGSLALLLSTRAPSKTGDFIPDNISCFVSTYISPDNSFLSVRQEPSCGPLMGVSLPATLWLKIRFSLIHELKVSN